MTIMVSDGFGWVSEEVPEALEETRFVVEEAYRAGVDAGMKICRMHHHGGTPQPIDVSMGDGAPRLSAQIEFPPQTLNQIHELVRWRNLIRGSPSQEWRVAGGELTHGFVLNASTLLDVIDWLERSVPVFLGRESDLTEESP